MDVVLLSLYLYALLLAAGLAGIASGIDYALDTRRSCASSVEIVTQSLLRCV